MVLRDDEEILDPADDEKMYLRLASIVLLFCTISVSNVSAYVYRIVDKDLSCLKELKKSLTPTQLLLLNRVPLLQQREFTSCEWEEAVDNHIVEAIRIFRVSSGAISVYRKSNVYHEDDNFNLIDLEGNFLGGLTNTEGFPAPYRFVDSELKTAEDENGELRYPDYIKRFHETFIQSRHSWSNGSLNGLIFDLNRFTHSFAYESSIIQEGVERTASENFRLYYLLYSLDQYLKKFRHFEPEKWARLESGTNKIFLDKVITQSLEVVRGSDPCSRYNDPRNAEYEWIYAFEKNMFNPDNPHRLNGIAMFVDHDLLGTLQCDSDSSSE